MHQGQQLAVIPVAIIVPTMLVTVPPSVVPVPATFSFRVQISPAIFRLAAVLAVFANRLIELRFSAFNFSLALCMIFRIRLRHGNEHHRTQSRRHYRRYRKSSQML